MKYIILISIVSFTIFFNDIPFKKNHSSAVAWLDSIPAKRNKTELDDYPYGVITDTGKISFLKRFKKGKAIYIETCAKCHDSTKNGKAFYPDFSLPQLMDYEMRFQYPAHNEDLNETNITVAELDDVVDFLRYKKKNLHR